MIYKPSKYNTIINEGSDEFLFNTSTGALARIVMKEYKDLVTNYKEIEEDESEPFRRLSENKFIIPENVDELANIRTHMWKRKYKVDTLSLCICPTYQCNLQCSYCFEKDWQIDKNIYMSIENINSIIKYIDDTINSNNIKKLRIQWSGGEPLLLYDKIINANNQIIKLCDMYKIEYTSTLVTNMTIINDNMINKFVDTQFNYIQVSLDGPKSIHNKYRKSIEMPNTYDTILTNIETISKKIKKYALIVVRMHVRENSLENTLKVIDDLEERNLKNRIRPIFARIRHVEEESVSVEEYAKDEIRLYERLINTGWKTDIELKIRARRIGCAIYGEYAYTIGPNMGVYKCWELVNERYKCGSIDLNGKMKKNDLENITLALDPFDFKKCRECFQLPICMGGCFKQILSRYNSIGEHIEADLECMPIKYNMDQMIKLYIRSIKSSDTY